MEHESSDNRLYKESNLDSETKNQDYSNENMFLDIDENGIVKSIKYKMDGDI
jgi:uncharacterized protein YuzE